MREVLIHFLSANPGMRSTLGKRWRRWRRSRTTGRREGRRDLSLVPHDSPRLRKYRKINKQLGK